MRPSILLTPALAVLAFGIPIEERSPVAAQEDAVATPSVSLTVGVPVASGNYIPPTPTDLPASPVVLEHDQTTPAPEEVVEKRTAPPTATLYRQAAMQRHNLHRANHGAGPVTWSANLERAAMKSAQRCTFDHFMGENGLSYGQNLALGSPASNIAGIITDQWYSEVKSFSGDYGQAQPNYGTNYNLFAKWGHFTQLVWKDTAKIGCATWKCPHVATSKTDSTPLGSVYGGDITYCNYQGPGNYANEYASNIGRPKSSGLVSPDYGVNQKAIAASYSKWTGQKW